MSDSLRAPSALRTGRAAFRAWRGARPFWAGLFVLLAGAEILFLALAPPALLPAMGIGGIGTWLMGALLVTAGVLLWFLPALRVLLGVAAILFTLVSLVTSNLGGFLLGALLGLIGGALACAWTPRPAARPAPSETVAPAAEEIAEPARDAERAVAGRHRSGGGFGAFAIVLGVALAAGAVTTGRAEADLLPLPLPGTSPSPTASPAPSASPDGTSPGEGLLPDPGATPTPDPDKDKDKNEKDDGPAPKADADAVPRVHTPTVRSTAARMVTHGIDFQGIAKLRTDDGRRDVLAFAMDRVTLNDYLMSAPGGAKMLHCDVLTLTGNVRLYTSELRVKVLGLPLTLTPDTPKLLLKAVKLTDGRPSTDVRQLQDFVRADNLSCTPATNWAG